MRDLDDPELLTYLTDENTYANAWFADHESTIETLFDEIRSRVQETDMSVPVRSGPWWYVSSTVEGSSYPIHHRGPTRDTATEQILLDENVEAAGHEYFDVGAFDMSHDHTMAAWSFDTQGDERYTLHVRDLATGDDLADEILDVANAGVAWSRDGAWLFYVTADEQERPFRVWRHAVGSTPDVASDDVLIYEELDERYFVGVGETRSDDFVIIQSSSKTSSEIRLIPLRRPDGRSHARSSTGRRRRIQRRPLGRCADHAHQRRCDRFPPPDGADGGRLGRSRQLDRTRRRTSLAGGSWAPTRSRGTW